MVTPVAGTPFDFTCRKQLGVDIYTDNQQLRDNRGYNHCYILKEQPSRDMVLAACLCEPASKRRLTVMTDLPGVLLYTAGYYEFPDTAVCLETQFYPNSINQEGFARPVIRAGEKYESTTCYKFSVK